MYVDIVLDDSEMKTIQKGGFVSFVTPEGVRITATMTSGCKITRDSEKGGIDGED